jgi:hypothetical protein
VQQFQRIAEVAECSNPRTAEAQIHRKPTSQRFLLLPKRWPLWKSLTRSCWEVSCVPLLLLMPFSACPKPRAKQLMKGPHLSKQNQKKTSKRVQLLLNDRSPKISETEIKGMGKDTATTQQDTRKFSTLCCIAKAHAFFQSFFGSASELRSYACCICCSC